MLRKIAMIIICLFFAVQYGYCEDWLRTEKYIIKIPSDWIQKKLDETMRIKKAMAIPPNLPAKYNNNFYVYSNKKDYLILLYEMVYRDDISFSSFEERHKMNMQNMKSGINAGVVKKVVTSEIVKINTFENTNKFSKGTVMDWIGNTSKHNNRNRIYTIDTQTKNVTITLSAFFYEKDIAFSDELENTIHSIKFR